MNQASMGRRMSVDEESRRDAIPGMTSGPRELEQPAELGGMAIDRLAHELRTPLAAIQSMAEALAGGHLGRMENERHAGYVESIAETARHALAVVDAMLLQTSGAAAAGEPPAALDVARLAREISAGMGMLAARRGVRLELRDTAGPVWAEARATDVRQMLINLVSNGIAHTGGGSTVQIETGSRDRLVWIAVTDNGAGIPQSVIDCLEAGVLPDAAADADAAPRVRLGLTLTRALAGANGGRLEIKGTASGTEARVLLPAAQ